MRLRYYIIIIILILIVLLFTLPESAFEPLGYWSHRVVSFLTFGKI